MRQLEAVWDSLSVEEASLWKAALLYEAASQFEIASLSEAALFCIVASLLLSKTTS